MELAESLEAVARRLGDILVEVTVRNDLLLKLGSVLWLQGAHGAEPEGGEAEYPLVRRRQFLKRLDVHVCTPACCSVPWVNS